MKENRMDGAVLVVALTLASVVSTRVWAQTLETAKMNSGMRFSEGSAVQAAHSGAGAVYGGDGAISPSGQLKVNASAGLAQNGKIGGVPGLVVPEKPYSRPYGERLSYAIQAGNSTMRDLGKLPFTVGFFGGIVGGIAGMIGGGIVCAPSIIGIPACAIGGLIGGTIAGAAVSAAIVAAPLSVMVYSAELYRAFSDNN